MLLFTVFASLIADCVQLPPIKLLQELKTCNILPSSFRPESIFACSPLHLSLMFYRVILSPFSYCLVIILPFVVQTSRQNELANGSDSPVWSVNKTVRRSHRLRSPHNRRRKSVHRNPRSISFDLFHTLHIPTSRSTHIYVLSVDSVRGLHKHRAMYDEAGIKLLFI